MSKVINCECGYTVHGETDADLLADARQHMASAHSEMDPPTDEELLSVAVEERSPAQ